MTESTKQFAFGQSVQVKIVSAGKKGDLRAENKAFTKIAFISRRWMSRNKIENSRYKRANPVRLPKPGEEWVCRIEHDTRPEDPRTGALILTPVLRVKEELRWTSNIVASDEEPPHVLAICVRAIGNRMLETRKFKIVDAKQIPANCKDNNRSVIMNQLDAIPYYRMKPAISTDLWLDGREVVVVNLYGGSETITLENTNSVPADWPDRLKKEIYLSFSRIAIREKKALQDIEREKREQERKVALELKIRLAQEEEAARRAAIEAQLKGRKDVTVTKLARERNNISERILITLSNGTQVQVSSHYSWKAALDLFFKPTLSWDQAKQLKVGSVLGYEYPFQWVDGWLTNGELKFPKTRPERSEWRQYPISAIPAECWEIFLSGLKGKFAADLLPWHTQVTTRPKATREPSMTPRQKELQAIVQGQMWNGEEDDCDRVAIGKNLIFHVKTAGRKMLYIVDNPGVGAIYLFSDARKAKEFASGIITRTEAIERNYPRIIHREGWQEKVAAAVSGDMPLAITA